MLKKSSSDPDVTLELSEHLPYLFKHIHAQLQAASAGHLAAYGVDVAVWRILAVLWQHGDLSHRELSDLTSIEVSTLSRISKAVKREGLIRRTRTQEDQRTVRVALTEKGRALTQAIIPGALRTQANIVGNLSPEDVETLIRILHVIVENLNAYSKTDPDIDAGSAIRTRPSKANGAVKFAARPSRKATRPCEAPTQSPEPNETQTVSDATVALDFISVGS